MFSSKKFLYCTVFLLLTFSFAHAAKTQDDVTVSEVKENQDEGNPIVGIHPRRVGLFGEEGIASSPSEVSPIHSGKKLPFRIKIEKADFKLPHGVHSGVLATHHGKWLLFAGRTNGMHGFNNDNKNFPPQKQNTRVFVVDPHKEKVYERSLDSPHSGLSQEQIDLLSVTSPQFYQKGDTLYITGGYGVETCSGQFNTKDVLTAVDVPGLIKWVTGQGHAKHHTASHYIRQISDPVFQVTGGYMTSFDDHATLLVFGQNFAGAYIPGTNGIYTEQVRRFKIIDDGQTLAVKVREPSPEEPDPNYRRRDLNIVRAIRWKEGFAEPYLIAFSGVFTLAGGPWLVPVTISPSGHPSTEDPTDEKAFKQGMNNYICASIGLFSNSEKASYTLFLGGISYGYFNDGTFVIDPELPFINQVTAIRRSRKGRFKQYLLDAEYPVIPSKHANPGNPLLFGAGAFFVFDKGIPQQTEEVLELDAIEEPTLIGYIVGGIQSSLPNTNTMYDSGASPYIFKVTLYPQHR